MFKSEIIATNRNLPGGTKFIIRTYFHYDPCMFVTDFYMYDDGWNEGYDPLDHENFECRVYHGTISSESELKILHEKACDEISSGKFCSGRYLFS